MPNGGRDFPDEEDQVAEHIRAGAGAVWIRPGPDCWLLTDWCAGPLLAALEARRLPVVCLERLVNLEQFAGLAKRYRRLPLILAEIGYRSGRSIIPLLERFRNVHLSIGSIFSSHGGIEQLVSLVGPQQLLFGTGFPDAESMAAITQLTYAEIPDTAKRLIGAGNFRRLRGEVVR